MWWPTKVAFGLKSTSLQGIGLMCGTSQDALDLADVLFTFEEEQVHYKVLGTQTVSLPQELRTELAEALSLDALHFITLDQRVGEFFGQAISEYLAASHSEAHFVASHGITSFHQPEKAITHQLGSGAVIAAWSHLPVVNGFREQDVALGGQGAPLVPFCDQLLFGDYDATLNLGGFANVSLLNESHLIGFDVSPANLLLNHFSQALGADYDEGGNWARSGSLIPSLLEQWNALPYYHQTPPKSLGKEWLYAHILNALAGNGYSPHDLLHTAVHHISDQISSALDFSGKCLITGGGAFNLYLIEQLREKCIAHLYIPSKETVAYKEAICFALLGALRLRETQNIAPSVTGARHATCAGYVHLPPLKG